MSTVTVVTLERHGHAVTVMLEGGCFVITTDTGYRAVLPACGHDDGSEPCPIRTGENGRHPIAARRASVDAWLKHARTHCHDWHEGSAVALAKKVLATYRRSGGRPSR